MWLVFFIPQSKTNPILYLSLENQEILQFEVIFFVFRSNKLTFGTPRDTAVLINSDSSHLNGIISNDKASNIAGESERNMKLSVLIPPRINSSNLTHEVSQETSSVSKYKFNVFYDFFY